MVTDPTHTSKGSVPFKLQGYTFHTHYRIYGNIRSRRPLVALHGGPGVMSAYMEPFTHLLPRFNIPVVLYDQLGCGASLPLPGTPERKALDELGKDPAKFWTTELFMSELDNLLKALSLSENFDLLGHSWGGMLAAAYTIHYQPQGLKNLVLADTLARIQDWVDASVMMLISPEFNFPKENRNVIKFAEKHPDAKQSMTPEEYSKVENANVDLKSEAYQQSLDLFLRKFVLRIDPWPESWNRALEGLAGSPVGEAASVLKVSGDFNSSHNMLDMELPGAFVTAISRIGIFVKTFTRSRPEH